MKRELKNRAKDWNTYQSLALIIGAFFVCFILAVLIDLYYPNDWMIERSEMNNVVFKSIWLILLGLHIALFFVQQFFYYYRYSKIQYLILSYSGLIYLMLRSFDSQTKRLDIYPIYPDGWLTYLDISFTLIGLSLVISALRDIFPIKEIPIVNTFLEDNPLSEEKDLTQFDNLVKQIEPALFIDRYNSAFSIGIIGPWGSGKSSFIKAIEKRIESEDNSKLVYISFSPFLNHNEEKVIHEFFVQLSNELKKRSGRLSSLLLNYSAKLSNAIKDGNPISFLKPSEITNEKESVGELYNEIESVIKLLNLKIIISIDDLDRLNTKEILQVLKLIRNTSNFPNVVFLVSLDKDYVVDAIGSNSDKHRKFIDKFFQLEVHISRPPFDKVKDYAVTNILSGLRQAGLNDFNINELNNSFKVQELRLDKFILHYRDAKRFVNQYVYDFRLVHEKDINIKEIEYFDFCVLTLFKIFCQQEFNSIQNNSENIILKSQFHENIWYYDTLSKNNKLEEHISLIFQKIFPIDENPNFEYLSNVSRSSIAFEKVLRLYFERTLPNDELTEFEFNQIYNVESINSAIVKVIDLSRTPKRLDSFITILLNRKTDTDDSIYYKARILMHVINLKEYFDSIIYNRFFDLLIELYYSIGSNIQFDIINKAFETKEYSIQFKANLLVGLSKIDDYEKKTKRKILDDATNILHKFSNIDSDLQFYSIYDEFKETFNTLWNINSIHEDLVEYTTEKIVKPNALNFINCIIVKDEDIINWKFDPITFKLFENYNLIQDLGNDSIDKSSDALLEYFDFLELNALVNWKKSIIYEFNHLKPYRGLNKEINVISELGEIIFECRIGFKDKIKDTAIFFDFCSEHIGINYYQFRNKDYWVIPFKSKETHLLGKMVKKFRDLGKVYDNVNLRSIVDVGEIVQDKKTSETIISIRSIQPYVDLSKLPSTLTKL